MAAAPGRLCERSTNSGGAGELIFRTVALENLADFKQSRIGEAAVGILCAAIKPGNRLGRMSERSAAMGLASASSAVPPPNSSACASRRMTR